MRPLSLLLLVPTLAFAADPTRVMPDGERPPDIE